MTSYAYVYLCHSALCFATYTPGIAMRNKVWAVLCTIYSYHLRQRATALAEITAVSLLLLWVSEYHCACCNKYEGTFRKITDEGPNILNFLSFVLLMPNEIERDSHTQGAPVQLSHPWAPPDRRLAAPACKSTSPGCKAKL